LSSVYTAKQNSKPACPARIRPKKIFKTLYPVWIRRNTISNRLVQCVFGQKKCSPRLIPCR
jgi:hypothetical protein